MRRVQLTPSSRKNKEGQRSGGPRGSVARSPAAASSLFNLPSKRDGETANVVHESTNTETVLLASPEGSRDPVERGGAGGEAAPELAPTPVLLGEALLQKKKEVVDVGERVAAIEGVCKALEADAIEPADADAKLSSLSTDAILAAAPLESPKDREVVFEVARKLWNWCVSCTNSWMTDAHHVKMGQDYREPLAQSELLTKKKEAAAAVTLLRVHCCNLLEASLLCDSARAAGQSQLRVQETHVGLTFTSKTAVLLHEEGKIGEAEKMFKRAVVYIHLLQSWLIASRRHDKGSVMEATIDKNLDVDQIVSLIFDTQVTHASNAWYQGATDQCLNLLGDAFSVATAADVNEANASAMLSKLVSVRLHIGKMALTRANKENGGDFVGNAKYAVMILEGAYDVLTNWLPASWMHAELRNETRDGPETVQMEHDGEEDDNAQNQQDMELTSHTPRNDAMHIEVLRYLACASVYAEKYAASATCVELLRKHLQKSSNMTPHLDFTLSYISFLGQIGTDAVLDAQRTIKQMIQNTSSNFRTCSQALIKLVHAAPKLSAEAVQLFSLLVSNTLQSSSESDTAVAQGSVLILEALLEEAMRSNSDDVVESALSLLSGEAIYGGLLKCQVEYRRAYNLIFNAGSLSYKGGHYHLANKLFQCSLEFQSNSRSMPNDTSGSDRTDPGRAKLLRLQARCKIESGLIADALACIATVEALESPISPATLLLKLKTLLLMGEKDAEILELLHQLKMFRDPDYLIAAVRETEESQNHKAAATCFLELHNLITQDCSEEEEESAYHHSLKGLEMLVFRLAMFHTIEVHNKKDVPVTGESSAVQIGKLFQKLLERLKVAKKNSLTMADGEYFAGVAWNTGLTACTQEEWTPAAVCFSACARLLSTVFISKESETSIDKATFQTYQLRNVSAMLMTGACLLEIYKAQHGADVVISAKNTQGLVNQARSALTKQQETVKALMDEMSSYPAHDSASLLSVRNSGLVLMHELSCLTCDTSTEVEIVKKAGDLTSATEVITMAENSRQYGTAVAAARGFDIALTMLLASPQRDTPSIASVIRQRIEIEDLANTTNDAQETLVELYASAATHLSLLATSYPSDEAAWLVTTAFNRGVAHHRMLRYTQAKSMFEMARSILPHALRSDPKLERLHDRIEEAMRIVQTELLSEKSDSTIAGLVSAP